jgi:hypothetical protein
MAVHNAVEVVRRGRDRLSREERGGREIEGEGEGEEVVKYAQWFRDRRTETRRASVPQNGLAGT